MPEQQANDPAANGAPAASLVVAMPMDHFDEALGCECANPALQIDCWCAEMNPPPPHVA